MRIRSQIILAQLPTAIIISLVTFFFIFILVQLEKKSEAILVDNFKSVLAMQSLNESLEELNGLKVKNESSIEGKKLKIKNIENKIEQQLFIQDANTKELGEKELTQALHEKWKTYKEHNLTTDHILSPVDIDNINKLYKEVKKLSFEIIMLNQDALVQKKGDFSKFISNFLFFITFGSIMSLIFGFFTSWFFTGLFLSPLDKMADIMSRVGRDGDTTYLHIKGSDEIEKLSDEFNMMTSRLEEYHRTSLGQVMKEYQILKTTLDVFPDPVFLLDPKDEVAFMNYPAQTLLGFSGNYKKINPLIHMEGILKEALITIIHQVMMTKSPYVPENIEEAIPFSKENKKIFFLPWAYPVKKTMPNGSQELHGVVLILQDLMRQPQVEIGKVDVYETLIHEFQSPLNEIQMAIYTCVQENAGPLTEKQQEILYGAHEKCDYLEKLCLDLLNFSQVNQKSQSLEKEEIDLSQLVGKMIASLQLESYQKGIFIEVEEPPYLSKVHANIKQIDILLNNIFHNALQHAEPGSNVKIKITEKKNAIEISVNNKGTLIPLEHRKNIFKKYFKVPGQAQEGAGLGLYIAKQIIQSLGGKIGFKSSEKEGTTFWFEIPFDEQNVQKREF
ncbi:MAG: HAMP domain-containing protein [Alphaproteobacteria bacterium]|nr:HAMP domain-containing protein [Alphaproteobacteria bacterium]